MRAVSVTRELGYQRSDGSVVRCVAGQAEAHCMQPSHGVIGKQRIGATNQRRSVGLAWQRRRLASQVGGPDLKEDDDGSHELG
jgi:hypothetical protein